MDSSSVVDSALGVALAAGLTFSLLSALFASGAVPVRIVVVRRLALNIGVFGGAVLLANKAACGLVRGCIVRSQCDCWI